MTDFSQPNFTVSSCVRVFFLLLTFLLVPACGISNGVGIEPRIEVDSSIELGTAFHHVVLSKSGYKTVHSPLRIYIEGDGKPFINRTTIAHDPTPRYGPVRALWELDFGNALYIGRPCYLGLANLAECNAGMWTSGRYNRLIVESMQAVVERYSNGRPAVLIGHSGGGTLAMLVASRMSAEPGRDDSEQSAGITAVVTLSGNLDVTGWAKLHGYSALHQSDSPADSLPLAAHIMQLHIIAGRDSKIPPYLTRNLANRLPSGSICEVAAYDHNCCWSHRWEKFLSGLDRQFSSESADLQSLCAIF